jgi:23S rRNA pseudouridine2605 synthase
MRLQKYIAKSGITSRRKAEELILKGQVTVNGKLVNNLGTKVKSKDLVKVDGKLIKIKKDNIYILLNKPEGYITTAEDQFGRKDVLSLVDLEERVYPVGRLDYNSTGLLVLTNDGDLTYKLTHPKHDIKKKYFVKLKGLVEESELNKLKKPINIDNKRTRPAEIEKLETKGNDTFLLITIKEGRNRQVRKLCERSSLQILRLKRVSIGELELGSLRKGKWRYLKDKEIKYLKKIVK